MTEVFNKAFVEICELKKLFTSFILVGIFYSLTALTLLFSICTSHHPTITTRMGILLALKLYFDYLKQRLCFSTTFENHIII